MEFMPITILSAAQSIEVVVLPHLIRGNGQNPSALDQWLGENRDVITTVIVTTARISTHSVQTEYRNATSAE